MLAFNFHHSLLFGFLEIVSSKNLSILIWKCLAKREIKHSAQSRNKIDSLVAETYSISWPSEGKKINTQYFKVFKIKYVWITLDQLDHLLKV